MHTRNLWQPTASLSTLQQRAHILQQIRHFFADRHVLEVETPAMSHATITDIHLHPFQTQLIRTDKQCQSILYLMTSPEYHMKRLLAAGYGSIYQIARVFRNEEQGRYHNPEFTLLEWYRVSFSMSQLIDELDQLLQLILKCTPAQRTTYQQLFKQYLNIDPLTVNKTQLETLPLPENIKTIIFQEHDIDTLLQLLFSTIIEPQIGQQTPIVVTHFPASQAALAEIDKNDPRVALRFEVYHKGIELANGFYELRDAKQQLQRFLNENQQRQQQCLEIREIDYHLIDSLAAGFPPCSGVALGIDRLIMLAVNATRIDEVIAFPTCRA